MDEAAGPIYLVSADVSVDVGGGRTPHPQQGPNNNILTATHLKHAGGATEIER